MPDPSLPHASRASPQKTPPLVRVEGVSKRYLRNQTPFGGARDDFAAVDDVNLSVYPAETLALVGESGCGKTTLAKLLLRLVRPSAGEIFFQDTNITHLPERKLRPLRPRMQLIFQDPANALPPRRTLFQILREAMRLGESGQAGTEEQIADVLEQVGLPKSSMGRYPHTFSGGQKQRIAIARALAVDPHFIVCDEAVSALDASVQLQIIQLLREVQHRYGIAYLFITHDLSVARQIADRIAVMHQGRIVECAPTEALWHTPRHPYSKMLLAAAPRLRATASPQMQRPELRAENRPPLLRADACGFAPLCPLASEICQQRRPRLQPIEEGEVACHEARD